MRAKKSRPALVISTKRRLIIVHPDLLQNDEFFSDEVFLAQGWTHHTTEQIGGFLLLCRQHGSVINGVFLVGECVCAGTHPIKTTIDFVPREILGALKDHVFQKVTGTP